MAKHQSGLYIYVYVYIQSYCMDVQLERSSYLKMLWENGTLICCICENQKKSLSIFNSDIDPTWMPWCNIHVLPLGGRKHSSPQSASLSAWMWHVRASLHPHDCISFVSAGATWCESGGSKYTPFHCQTTAERSSLPLIKKSPLSFVLFVLEAAWEDSMCVCMCVRGGVRRGRMFYFKGTSSGFIY